MPIEIKELLIKAVVSDTTRQQTVQAISPADISKLKKELVKDCVQEVLQKLKEKNER